MHMTSGLTVETGGFDVLYSGTVLTHRGQDLVFRIQGAGSITFKFTKATREEADAELRVDDGADRDLTVEFYNFLGNFMGSSVPVRIGTLWGRATYLNYLVVTPDPNAERVLHYTVYVGQTKDTSG